jgi:hypothetical protein
VNHLQPGDRVEWVGGPPKERDDPKPGERGTVIVFDPPADWVVDCDEAGTAVFFDRDLRKVGDEP